MGGRRRRGARQWHGQGRREEAENYRRRSLHVHGGLAWRRTQISCRRRSPSSRWVRAGWERAAWCVTPRIVPPRCAGSAARACELGLGGLGVTASPLPGPRGTWNISCGCGGARRRLTKVSLAADYSGGTQLVRQRMVLVTAHTGRENALRSARFVADRLAAAGIAVRTLAGQVQLPRRRTGARRRLRGAGRGAGHRPGRRRQPAARRRILPPRRGAADRGEPRPRRVPRRGRAGRAGRYRRPAGGARRRRSAMAGTWRPHIA